MMKERELLASVSRSSRGHLNSSIPFESPAGAGVKRFNVETSEKIRFIADEDEVIETK